MRIIIDNIQNVIRNVCSLRMILLFFTLHSSLFILHSSLSTLSAQALGSWQIYPSYTTATKSISVGNRIYALMETKLMAYDTEDESITTFDCLHQLNDVAINFVEHSSEAKRLIIVYDNGNIDLLSTEDDADIMNLPYIKNSTLQDKTINNVCVSGSTAYVCTGFGIVVVDMVNAVILSTYNLGKTTYSAASDGNYIYVGANDGVWRGLMTSNLQDKSVWTSVNTSMKSAQWMDYFDGRIVAFNGNYLCIGSADGSAFNVTQKYTPTFVTIADGCLIFGDSGHVDIYSSISDVTTVTGTFAWTHLTRKGSTFWASCGIEGLQAYTLNDGTFQLRQAGIHPNSPIHDYSHHLEWVDGRLLVTGGSVSYGYITHPGTAMILEQDGTWTNFDYQSAVDFDPQDRYINATDIAQDPLDATHHYVGMARDGVYEFRDGKCVGHLTLGNSPLKSILPDNANPKWFVVGSGTRYDPDGNLWVLNSAQDTIINILMPSGKWKRLYYSEIDGTTAVDNVFFDSRGWAWMTSRRMDGRGLFCLNYNGTLDVVSDDRHILRSRITNQDNTSYDPDEFYCVAEDHSGAIWLGTVLGPFLVSDPETYMDTDFTFEQVKVSRNDGSGLADYLLSGIPITSIAVDGGNRKWFGTLSNGVYLISEDCQEQIYHFTTDNSPLLDDDINDIAIDGSTGRVFFATNKGLCSFMADATDPVESPTDDGILAYPNPVHPDYNGPIAIRGLAEDSEVRIIAPSGHVVCSGTSTGGMFTWNGCNAAGKRVASGVYIVMAALPSGRKAVATKIAFIK